MKVVLAGGGTGGHIYPAIAIAKYVKEKNPNADILFIGTKKGLEVELVPKAGFNLETIVIRGLARDKILQQLIPTFIELVTGTIEARRLLKQFSPDIVIVLEDMFVVQLFFQQLCLEYQISFTSKMQCLE